MGPACIPQVHPTLLQARALRATLCPPLQAFPPGAAGLEMRAWRPSVLEETVPAGEGCMPESQDEDEEPGPEVLEAAVQAQRQHQQGAHGQPQEQGDTAGTVPARHWGWRGAG